MKLKKTQLFCLVIKLAKPFAVFPRLYQMLMRDENLREVSVLNIFVLIITLMLSRIFSEALISISNKHSYKIFTESRPTSFLHCVENILNHSSGKCRDSLTMAALSFTNSAGFCTVFIH